jgi:hypothetical protein
MARKDRGSTQTEENPEVSDTTEDVQSGDLDLDVQPDPEPAVAPAAGGEASAPAAQATKSKKDPLPEGWVTPTMLANELGIRPQIVYGYVRNGSGFPSKNHTDSRFIVHRAQALQWLQEKDKRKAERAAKQQAQLSAAAAAAQQSTPEVGGESTDVTPEG